MRSFCYYQNNKISPPELKVVRKQKPCKKADEEGLQLETVFYAFGQVAPAVTMDIAYGIIVQLLNKRR